MNRFTATKTIPVTQNVMCTVSSIIPQLDAIGVKYHGLSTWKRTEPTTSNTNAIATTIAAVPD